MMNLNDLINIKSLIKGNTGFIEEFVSKYPYCQSGQLILLLNYKRNKNLSYSKQLAVTSIYSLNRKVLINIINDENSENISDIDNKIGVKQVDEISLEFTTINAEAKGTEIADNKTIIDDFIIKEPRIEIKKEFFAVNDLSEVSTLDNFDLVSETLAQIYAKQGNYEKAIKTFEKLCLKYPEKNSYFANQIENLKKQSNIN